MAKGIKRTKENGQDYNISLSGLFPSVRLSLGKLLLSRACLRFTEQLKLTDRSGKDDLKNNEHRDFFVD